MSGRTVVAGAVVLLILVVGCSSDDPPASLPSSAPPATSTQPPAPSSTATPTTPVATGAPTVPAEAQQQTPEGAAAFVEYWYETLQYSQSIMDSSALRALDDGTCLSCDNFAASIDVVAAEGNRLQGGGITVFGVQPNAIGDDGDATVSTLIAFAEQRIISPDGTAEVLAPAEDDVQFFFTLVLVDSSWRVGGIQLLT